METSRGEETVISDELFRVLLSLCRRSRSFFPELSAKRMHVYVVAVVRVAGALQRSTDVMKAMQSLVKVPEIQATMRDLSKEMMKVGQISCMHESLDRNDII